MASVHKNIYLCILVRLYMMCFVRANAFLQLALFQDFAIDLWLSIFGKNLADIFYHWYEIFYYSVISACNALQANLCSVMCCSEPRLLPAFISMLTRGCYSSMLHRFNFIWCVLFWAHGLICDYGPIVFGSTDLQKLWFYLLKNPVTIFRKTVSVSNTLHWYG